jgi:Flp pilus assembly protein TadG
MGCRHRARRGSGQDVRARKPAGLAKGLLTLICDVLRRAHRHDQLPTPNEQSAAACIYPGRLYEVLSTIVRLGSQECSLMPIAQGISFAKRAIRQRARALWSDEGGTAVVEFAIVAPAFIAFLLGTLYMMMIYAAQQMLETTAEDAGRLLLTGTAQTSTLGNGHVGMTATDFKNAICNGTTVTDTNGDTIAIPKLLPAMLTCSRLTVNVATATSYNVASTAAPTFTYNSSGVVTATNTGFNLQSGGFGQNQILVLQLIYLWPTAKGPLGVNFVNQPNSNRMLVATSAFTTEDYTCNASQSSC